MDGYRSDKLRPCGADQFDPVVDCLSINMTLEIYFRDGII